MRLELACGDVQQPVLDVADVLVCVDLVAVHVSQSLDVPDYLVGGVSCDLDPFHDAFEHLFDDHFSVWEVHTIAVIQHLFCVDDRDEEFTGFFENPASERVRIESDHLARGFIMNYKTLPIHIPFLLLDRFERIDYFTDNILIELIVPCHRVLDECRPFDRFHRNQFFDSERSRCTCAVHNICWHLLLGELHLPDRYGVIEKLCELLEFVRAKILGDIHLLVTILNGQSNDLCVHSMNCEILGGLYRSRNTGFIRVVAYKHLIEPLCDFKQPHTIHFPEFGRDGTDARHPSVQHGYAIGDPLRDN